MTEQNQTANQEVTSDELVTETIQPEQTTNEDKFFGVKTTIGKTPEDRLTEKPKQSQETDEVEIEVVDDRPPEDRKPARVKTSDDKDDIESEIEGVDEQVKKRINRLKYEFHEERRAKEATEKVREEAIAYAQQIQEENKRLSALINKGEEALLGQISAKAQSELEREKQNLKKPMKVATAKRC